MNNEPTFNSWFTLQDRRRPHQPLAWCNRPRFCCSVCDQSSPFYLRRTRTSPVVCRTINTYQSKSGASSSSHHFKSSQEIPADLFLDSFSFIFRAYQRGTSAALSCRTGSYTTTSSIYRPSPTVLTRRPLTSWKKVHQRCSCTLLLSALSFEIWWLHIAYCRW